MACGQPNCVCQQQQQLAGAGSATGHQMAAATLPEGTPNGVSLARMARMKKPGVRVLFAARDENREHTEGVGEFLAVPATGADLVAMVERMLVEAVA
jgi:hypothetical protein